MIQTPRTVKYVVVDECVAGLAKRPFALRTLRIYTAHGDRLKTTVANPTHERKHTHGTNHSLTHSSTPRSCSEARGSGTTASGLCNPGEGGNTRDTSLEARTRSCGTNVGQLQLSLRDKHDIALLLQQREPHSVHIRLLLLHRYLVAARWNRIRQGRLNLFVQELLDLLWVDRNAEVPVRERGQFLVDKDLA